MVAFLSLFNFGLIPTRTTVLLPQHQSRGGGGGCDGGGGDAGGPSIAVGQKRVRYDELDTKQKKLRKHLQRKLQRRSKAEPNQRITLAMIDQAARDLEFVNGPQGKSLLIQRGQLGLN